MIQSVQSAQENKRTIRSTVLKDDFTIVFFFLILGLGYPLGEFGVHRPRSKLNLSDKPDERVLKIDVTC